MKLPKGYLSFSSLSLWLTNKDQYRAKYYHHTPAFSTTQTRFGNQVATLLEHGTALDPILAKVPRYSHPEYAFEVEVEGVPIMGYIDSFDMKTGRILEYKTGHKNKEGESPWDAVKVRQWLQLPFYSVAIDELHGAVADTCHLVWLETAFKDNPTTRKGLTRVSELALTGTMEIFERTIAPWERDRMRELVVKSAEDISDDYAQFSS